MRHIQLSIFLLLLLFLLLCSHRILLCIMGIWYISLLHTKSPSYMDFFEKFIYVNMNMSSIEIFLLRDCLRKYILLSIAKNEILKYSVWGVVHKWCVSSSFNQLSTLLVILSRYQDCSQGVKSSLEIEIFLKILNLLQKCLRKKLGTPFKKPPQHLYQIGIFW